MPNKVNMNVKKRINPTNIRKSPPIIRPALMLSPEFCFPNVNI